MKLFYVNHKGKRIDLNSSYISPVAPETLLSNEWGYTTTSAYSQYASISKTFKKVAERPLIVSVIADTTEDFSDIMAEIEEIFEPDVYAGRFGKLWWNDSYRECKGIKRTPDLFEPIVGSTDVELVFLSLDSDWVEEESYNLRVINASASGSASYPTMYPFVYPIKASRQHIGFDHYKPADFIMHVYGPCSNVAVMIGGNRYDVDVMLDNGEFLTIDSRDSAPYDRRCYVTHSNGSVTNAFNQRRSNGEDSIFAKISGASELSASANYAIDLKILRGRSDPRWI